MTVTKSVVLVGFLLLYSACDEDASVVSELREASKIANDSIRLHKYDQIIRDSRMAERESVDVDEPISAVSSKWMVTTDADPIDDSKRIIFTLMADKGTSDFGEPVILFIRYQSKKTEIFINWRDYLGDEVYVTMRIGDAQAETFQWSGSTDNTAAFYPRNCINLIKRIIQVEKAVFRCTPYNDNPVTAVFDVRGLKDEAEKYMGDLGWW